MRNYILGDDFKYACKSVSKGVQEKYCKDGYFYKLNTLGNEGYVEYLVSRLLKFSNLPSNLYVSYEYCRINGKLGCRSKNFLQAGETFMSMNTLYNKFIGHSELADHLMCLRDAPARLDYLLQLTESVGVPAVTFKKYLNILMQLDLLIQNTDRHSHNYGLIFSSRLNKFRPAPIFDNGASLGTVKVSSPVSCTLSGSFFDQVVAFGYPVRSVLTFDYKALFTDLRRIEQLYGKRKELDFLRAQLEEYSYLFDRSRL